MSNCLLKVLEKHHGLLEITTKVPVRDRYSLSLVYTPGVGKVCMEIKNNNSEVLNLTNKANSMIIITDGSGWPVKSDQRNYHMLPFIETLAVFYKQVFNIDAYPLILDAKACSDIEQVFETVCNLGPGYAGFELFGFDHDRLDKFIALWEKKPMTNFLITYKERDLIEQGVASFFEADYVKMNIAMGALLRSIMDLRCYQYIDKKAAQAFLEEMSSITHADEMTSENIYEVAQSAVLAASKILISQKLHTIQDPSEKFVKDRLRDFYFEGKEAWVKHTSLDYMSRCNTIDENAMELHRAHVGIISVQTKISIRDPSLFYQILNPKNQFEVSEKIIKSPEFAYEATCKGNLCAIITNGTRILGLGDIGPEAGLPVMEGKSILFKQLGGVDIVPICIREKDPKKFIEIVERLAPSFAAINLEDIRTPDCFEIERTLIKRLDIPVFHDDQHGTAAVCVAGFLNALRLLKKKPDEVKVVISGSGAAGVSITEMIVHSGAKNVVVVDTQGAIYKGRTTHMNPYKEEVAEITNPHMEKGDIQEVIKGADIYIGVSVAGALKPEWIKLMNEKPVIFALANPVPEIMPDEAKKAGAYIVGTGRSDFKNQINNSLVFPGLFRGAIDIRASKVTMHMKVAAARAIADLVTDEELNPDFIMPDSMDMRVPLQVAKRVAETGMQHLVARRTVDSDLISENLKYFMMHGHFNYEKSLTKCVIKKSAYS